MITLGGDPEAFFARDGKVIPAAVVFVENDILDDRIELDTGHLYVDGADIEFQPNPSEQPNEVLANITNLIEVACEFADVAETSLAIVPELPIDLEWCMDNPELAVFGCDPDKSIWGEECVPESIDASKHPWRYAGCHLHFGVAENPDFFKDRVDLTIASFDRTIGLLSLATSDGLGEQRRQIYGRPGIYRHQPWGIEYRTPSNTLLANDKLVTAYELGINVIKDIDTIGPRLKDAVPDEVVLSVLRYGSSKDAQKLLEVMLACM